MTNQITREELLELVSVNRNAHGQWYIIGVSDSIYGNVSGTVYGDVRGNVGGNVGGTVCGDVGGTVCGDINGREWQYVETPKDKIKRLIDEGADKEQLLEAVSQMEDN